MYFTIHTEPTSSPALPPDAREAHQRLSRQASTLAGLSASLALEALAVADAYTVALADGRREDWAAFVAATATLSGHCASVAPMLALSAREREADAYFAQIVDENADLLAACACCAA